MLARSPLHPASQSAASRARHSLRWLAACALWLVTTTPALAAPPCSGLAKCPRPVNSETARGLGLGTGSRASAISTSALSYNPAALVVGRLYHVEAAVDYMPEFDAVALGGAVVDSATAKVGAGFGLRGFLSGDTGLGGIDGRLGIAFPFTDTISIGLGGRYISLDADEEVTIPSTGQRAIIPRDLAQGFTMDASFRVQPAQVLQLELSSFNFINLESAYVPVLVGVSAGLALGTVGTIGVDYISDMTSFDSPAHTVGGGVEFLVGSAVPLRGGYAVDMERKLHMISAGLGYTDRWVGFDMSLQQQVKGGEETRVMGAFRYYVH
jgi:hypothetical protein